MLKAIRKIFTRPAKPLRKDRGLVPRRPYNLSPQQKEMWQKANEEQKARNERRRRFDQVWG